MPVWLITETCEYRVVADGPGEAEEKFLEHGPTLPDGAQARFGVEFLGVPSRQVQSAHLPGEGV